MKRSVAISAALVGPLVAGIGMSFGQSVAPNLLLPLFNSAAPVAAIAMAAALAGRRPWQATALGALAGPITMVGYFGTSALRGTGVSSSWLLFWCTAGVAVGVVLGSAVWVLRTSETGRTSKTTRTSETGRSSRVSRGLAAAAWPGIAIGEAVHGIVRIADSTPVGYWWTECAVAVAVLVATCAWHARSRRSVAFAVLGTVAVAGGLFFMYGAL